MAELPELTILQRQMDAVLSGHIITAIQVNQEKCLNVPVEKLTAGVEGRLLTAVSRRGKWLYLHLDSEYRLLLNLGMGADLWHYQTGEPPPEKYQLRVELDDHSGFTCRFWWFGYIRLLTEQELSQHPETRNLGPDPLALDRAEFTRLARLYPRTAVKSFLLDQEKISGIGNAYAHDILWQAKLHPLRKLGSLSEEELSSLHAAIQAILQRGLQLGGVERDFFKSGGNLNHWEAFMLVGYKRGQPCPVCGAPIAEIKTGSTKTYLCPGCQPNP